jgi:hypothetical protein
MWINFKMKIEAFTINNYVECLHVIVQGTHKLVVMSCIYFEDHLLIKTWRVGKKLNVKSEKIKDEKIQGNCLKQFAFH